MTSAGKVAEIFSAAGEAFTRLGTLAMHLQPISSEKDSRNNENGKWGDEEIELLRSAVQRFGHDLEKISDQIKTKSLSQIKSALKQKALKELGKDASTSNGKEVTKTVPLAAGKHKASKSSSSEAPPTKKQKSDSDNLLIGNSSSDVITVEPSVDVES